MKSNDRLVAYLVGLHLVVVVMILLAWREHPWVVLGAEAVLAASLVLGLRLARRGAQPLEYARRFQELLHDRNFAARLQAEPGDELGGLVSLYNTLLDGLYRERIRIGEQRGLLERMLEATPSAVLVFDFDGRISLLNASAQSLLGLHEPAGHPLSHWRSGEGALEPGLDEAARSRSRALIAQLDDLPVGPSQLLADAEGRRFRAQRGQFFDRGFAREFVLVEEITEEIVHSERATYEKLVRVLAHEVNNTVAATGSVLDSLASHLARTDGSDELGFGAAIAAVRRRNAGLGEFIERFTRVVKMPAAEPHPTDLAQMLEDIVQLYREPCRSRGIALEWERRDAVPAQALDRNLMEQALLNIVKNAMEAAESGARDGRRPAHVRLWLAREDGRVRLSVSDSGDRLGEVPAGQMFTPFFTTKKGGQGIGLLLVREVLSRHRLPHRLASTGQGETRFDIWFPKAG